MVERRVIPSSYADNSSKALTSVIENDCVVCVIKYCIVCVTPSVQKAKGILLSNCTDSLVLNA